MNKYSSLEPTGTTTQPVRYQTGPPGSRRVPRATPSSHDDSDITLGFLFGVWKQWWKWLVPMSVVMACVSTAVLVITYQPKFRATARLEIAEQSPWVIFRDDSDRASRYVQTQIEMLRSPRVLSAVFDDPRVASMPELKERRKPVQWLIEKGLEIEPVGESVFVSVAYEGPDAVSSAHLVNTVVDKYFQVQRSQKNLRTQKILSILNDAKLRQEEEVARLQESVKHLGKHLPDITPNLTGTDVVVTQTNPLQTILNQILAAELERENLDASVRALVASLQETGEIVASEALVLAEIEALPEVQTQKLRLQEQEAKLTAIEATARGGQDSPAYRNQRNKIQNLKSMLSMARESARDGIVQQVLAADRLTREQDLENKRTALATKTELVDALDRRYRTKREELGAQGGARLEFEFAQQELQRALGLLASISERSTQMSAEMVAPGRPEVYRKAAPPDEPEKKYPILEIAISAVGSLVLPFAFAFLWENGVRRINSVEQLEQKTDVDVIGEISRLPVRRGKRAAQVPGPELGLFEESIDSLRTGLLLSNEDLDLQILAVCSAVSGEGKTSVSSQLAVSIARATGQPVLLIDGDMRAPDIHQIFDVPQSPGLAEVLDGKLSLEEAVNRSWSEQVHLLPAGELTKSPHKLLGTSNFRTALEQARLWYRYIVIDTPPVLAASESLVTAKTADGVLLCTMRDFSRENHVRLAYTKLRATGAEIVGTVLNGVPVRTYAHRYGSYARYGYASTNEKGQDVCT